MSSNETRQERILQARLRLMDRFKEKMAASPSLSDPAPLGIGPKNRHQMPKLPVGQHETQNWPVLDLGTHPNVPKDQWSLQIDGAVEHPQILSWADFMGLEQIQDVSDFHCVTTWSKMDMAWTGVRVSTLLALAAPTNNAVHLMCHAYDGYTTNVPLHEALKDDVLLVHSFEGAPLSVAHGGPLRMITPQLYAWKGAKWIRRIEVLSEEQLGFWEARGYSSTAYPWKNDRYR
jgi:DMSO/TMAO reductase YedYZ molybdopterin-dependent catalytic subunit